MADAAADGHLLVDLERFTLDRKLPLALLPPDAAPLVPDHLPDTLLPEPEISEAKASPEPRTSVPGPTFDASTLPEKQREHFHRNLRAVEQVLAGAPQTRIAAQSGIPRSTLGRFGTGLFTLEPGSKAAHILGIQRNGFGRKVWAKAQRLLPSSNLMPHNSSLLSAQLDSRRSFWRDSTRNSADTIPQAGGNCADKTRYRSSLILIVVFAPLP